MKCIKNKTTNEIERVKDHIAYDRVNTGEWVFCPKHEYKEYLQFADEPTIIDDEQYRKDMQTSYNKFL